ncbi:ATP-binding protein [Helicobacter sp. MIT 05-5293]|uniref:ATP-binding protein n=1 Tax=Helicobacter sp. MIT 05-5293 TaxID=1548149 RepID=UPI00051DD6B4|nr:ATP-binding protein [Helicobacter sp. MIT 05-5293]TLD80465.1 ATP-binding protein [Helicobacter sp. MIT 05-5293]
MQEISKSYFERVASIMPRRYGINAGKVFLYGAPKTGKTSLALLYGAQFKKSFYIDCADKRMKIDIINAFLLKNYLEKNLEMLIIDHYTPSISLPNLQHIILIAPNAKDIPPDFQPKAIQALSFEEYVSFDHKNIAINTLFNLFLKEGNLPEIYHLEPSYKIPRKHEILKLALENDYEIFCSLLPMQAQKLTPHHIYALLKKSHKISKDRLYPLLEKLQKTQIIFFVPHLQHQAKKLYFYDFTLPLCVSEEKNFNAILENMLFLELQKQTEQTYRITDSLAPYFTHKISLQAPLDSLESRVLIDSQIFYGDYNEFITPLGVFIFIPFADKEIITQKLLKMPYERIFIITLSFESHGIAKHNNRQIQWIATTFINFALGDVEWEYDQSPL